MVSDDSRSLPFFTWLQERAQRIDSLLCVGLDPHLDQLPEPSADAAVAFCRRLIQATSDLALAFKPNSAFFETLGPAGLRALHEVIGFIPPEVPVILDVKRGDIPESSTAYAQAAFGVYGAQAVTVSPYLGKDALLPFMRDSHRGVFILCRSSNPGAEEIQGLSAEGLSLYERVALLAQSWNQFGNVGLVVGATDVVALQRVRALVPELWFLVPGVGPQGGNLRSALEAGLRADGLGMLVSVSRSLSQVEKPGQVAENLVEEMRTIRRQLPRGPGRFPGRASTEIRQLADLLLDCGCVRFGQFTLKSGQQSPIYIDLRRLVSRPDHLARIARAYLPILRSLSFQRLAGIPYAGLPIATAVALQGHWPMIYPRRETKDYGTRATIEGEFTPGETVAVLDDVATTGETKLEALERLHQAGLLVNDVVVLVDREQGAEAALRGQGVRLSSVARLTDLVALWKEQGKMNAAEAEAVLHPG
ncbi:MAG: orotidine-5'-phosphate decarboxylase [Anaerolineales bacterium]|jgi:uridine monophosphate synthetase